MSSAHGPADRELTWSEVSEILPCPICAGTTGCLLAETGDLVRCLRRESSWPVAEGGWLHRLRLGGPAREVGGIRPRP